MWELEPPVQDKNGQEGKALKKGWIDLMVDDIQDGRYHDAEIKLLDARTFYKDSGDPTEVFLQHCEAIIYGRAGA
jgi:hypothetical protein